MENQESTAATINPNQASELAAHGLQTQESTTTPSRPGKKPRPVWIVSGNVFGLEPFFYEIGGKKYRGSWSFFVDPSDDILKELETNGRASFADQVENKIARKEARIERFSCYAENAEMRSHRAFNTAQSISSMIPMGQPVLIGHHSEKRHRNDLNRIENGMQKGVEESKKAEHYNYKIISLDYEVNRTRESRMYIGNRIEDATKELSNLDRRKESNHDPKYRAQLDRRTQQAVEKLEYWQAKMRALESKVLENGGQIASAQTIKVGDEIYYSGWLPVVRVNRKTVTISNWLGVPTFNHKIEYTRIKKFRSKPMA